MDWIEIFGYCGSVIVAVSLMMKSIVKLRWYNLVGAAVFSTYGLIVNAYPVFVLNGFIAAVDLYYLVQMYKTRTFFSSLMVNPSDLFLKKFVDFYFEDIKIYFPDFSEKQLFECNNVFILRNMIPVGLISYKSMNDKAEIFLDYVIADYRDLENSKFMMSGDSNYFKEKGINILSAKTDIAKHSDYLLKIGFTKKADNYYEKTL